MVKRRGGPGRGDDAEASELTTQEILNQITASLRDNDHWRPTKTLANAMNVPFPRLFVTQPKDDPSNLVWTTVVVVAFCATKLVDFHELWYEHAETTVAWLFSRPQFVQSREDLVRSACALLFVHEHAGALITSIFAEPKDEETRALEAALGTEWKICYLEEPPYTMYFWNQSTGLTTWRNPLETAKEEQELLEKKRQKEANLAKFLPQRVKINRDRYVPVENIFCQACKVLGKRAQAQVLCLACGAAAYYCEDCCDLEHADYRKVGHILSSFRFRDCFGTFGFPERRKPAELVHAESRTATNPSKFQSGTMRRKSIVRAPAPTPIVAPSPSP
ncbi:TPA: hypothetical protein N0F65_012775 [Lagenidium giganteum]|uniref:WW domain-containing protein n=1 Tax=Lagenidium giganteum TaxID=4803 RepID=A0AAV2YEC6_9STRA|nr:TPA: hypothetical protein N0F65_012775 [Lagenidium giganteum]